MRRCGLVIAVSMLGGLIAACGGVEPAVQGQELALDGAPVWMAELDLPGCDCSAAAHADRLLLHPYDDQLVIAVADGAPSCVADRKEATRRDDSSIRPGLLLGPGGGIDPALEVIPEDDPVPIMPDGDSEERTGSDNGGSNNKQGTEDDDQPPTPGDTIKLDLNGDDPVPIRDQKILPVQLSHSLK